MQLAFRTRLMLGTTVMVVLFVGACAFAFVHLIDGYFEQQVEQEYDAARSSFATQRQLLFASLDREVWELSRSPRLLAMMSIDGVDAATLQDVVEELPSPVLAVLRADGTVLAGRTCWPADTPLSGLPGYSQHVETGVATGVWPHPRGLATVGIAPLVQGGEMLGSLVCGQLVDDAFAERIGALAGRDAVITHGGRLLGCMWHAAPPDRDELDEVLQLEADTLPPVGRAMTITVHGSEHTGIAVPLHRDAGVVFLAQNLDALVGLRDRMRTLLFVIGGALMAAGLFAAARTATRLSRPLHELARTADRVRDGDLTARVGALRADRELTRLAQSFDTMADTVQQLVADVRDKAARAEAANRAKDGFLTSISHEMRTPLTGIQSTAELLQQFGEDASREERAEFLETILCESARLGQRITDALEYAALAGDRAEWTVGAVDLQDACEQACSRIAGLRQLKSVDISILCPEPARLQGDRERIVQALEHLVRNAWQWSPDDGQVEIRVRRLDGAFAVDVADGGPGLAAEERQRVFDTFAQGGDVLVDKPDGIGIGLKIAAEVARMHGGSVEYSDRPEGGACFHVLLRTRDRPIDRLEAAHAPAATPAS